MKTRQSSPTKEVIPDFLNFVLNSVKDLFAFETNGHRKYEPEDIAAATLLMCAFTTSAETIQMLEALPSADRILSRLGAEKGLVLGERINQMLKQRIQKIPFPKGALKIVACDITGYPFFGDRNHPAVLGGKPTEGTSYFLKYLTFNLVVEGHRYPVGFYPLTQLQVAMLDNMIAKEIQWLKNHQLCDRVLFDRGFNGQNNYNKLDRAGTKFIMPIIENKKLQTGFAAFEPQIKKHQRKHGFVFTDYHPKEWPKDVHVVAYRTKVRGSKNPDQPQWVFFVTNLSLAPRTLWELYKRRWGIETAYRQVHTLQAVTNSRNYGVRVFLIGLSFLLFATWIHLNWSLAHKTAVCGVKFSVLKSAITVSRYQISITLPQFKVLLALSLLSQLAHSIDRKIDA